MNTTLNRIRKAAPRRVLGLLVGLALVATLATPGWAVPLSYFNDGAFVDTGNEGINMRAELVGLGHAPIDFVGTGDAAWAAALGSAGVMVIPELEGGNLAGALSGATHTAIANFVSGGGTLVIAGTNAGANDTGFLNTVFGYSLVDGTDLFSGTSNLNAAAAAGTTFAGGPDPLNNLDAVNGATTVSLPAGALSIYTNGPDTVVFVSPFGAGNVALVGYDWFDGQDAAWAQVLDAAVTFQGAADNVVPEPITATLGLMGLGVLGLATGRRVA